MAKYEFIGDVVEIKVDSLDGSTVPVRRVRALEDFGSVSRGDIGGFLEKEENLSHSGNCWVFGDAMVFGNAQVLDNAIVCDSARVFGNAVVKDFACIEDDAEVRDRSVVKGVARITWGQFIMGDVVIDI